MSKKFYILLFTIFILCSSFVVYFTLSKKEHKTLDSPRVVLIGLDGAGWNLINPMLEENALPHIGLIKKTGSCGTLHTARPVKSSVIWTSIATGKSMLKHGVLDWTYINAENMEIPYRQSERQAKTFWNIIGGQGWKVGVINWFVTFPPEAVNGYMVSEEFRHLGKRGFSQIPVTYPKNLLRKIDFARLNKKDYLRILEEENLPNYKARHLGDKTVSKLVLNYDNFVLQEKTVESASLYLFKRFPVDLYASYFRLIDVVSHFACAYIQPELLEKGLEEEIGGKVTENTLTLIDKDFSRVMKPVYSYSDKILGKLLEQLSSQSTLIVVSDHSFGFNKGGYGHTNLPEIPHGIILIKGPNIKKDYLIRNACIYDIFPTILYLFDLPVGKDMDGKVLTEVFERQFLDSRPIRYID
ncbi:MAG: alkaline phosphatase family protein, partial [Candidatus Aminicenantes bacterium]|nr:alkaline phosphatase family protein [Candidatus Aminicenantes bacterium]